MAGQHSFSDCCRSWLFWLGLCFSLALALLSGTLIYQTLHNHKVSQLSNTHALALGQVNAQLNSALGDVRHTALLLTAHLRDILEHEKPTPSIADALARLSSDIAGISQLRFISLEGQELARVNVSASGAISVVDQSALQNKATRYYVTEGLKSLPYDVYLSPIDLNVEHDQVELPHNPTVRSVVRTTDNYPAGEGLLVFNFSLRGLFEEISHFGHDDAQILIAEDDTRWILHVDEQKLWNLDLGKNDHTISKDKPALWQQVQGSGAVSALEGDYGDLFSSQSFILNEDAERTNPIHLYLVVKTPAHYYAQIKQQAAIPACAVGIAVFILGMWLTWREVRSQHQLKALNKDLAKEKSDLAKSLNELTLMQNELVETEKMASLGYLVAGVAHELNTPLGSAIMSLSSMQERLREIQEDNQTGLSAEDFTSMMEFVTNCSDIAERNVHRSAELIKRFKRIAVDRGTETVTTFSLFEMVKDLQIAIMPQLHRSHVVVNNAINESLEMHSFAGVLSQVLQNLIVNALDHAFSATMKPQITISATETNSEYVISVADNGSGIDESVRGNMYEPFVTTARSKGNTGLGLHLVYLWVYKILGGGIELEDTDPSGTTFHLYLPKALPDIEPEVIS